MAMREIIERVQRDIDAAGTSLSEADARAAFITPILAELGWSGLSRIRVEYRVNYGSGILDYALIGPLSRPLAFVEAKKPSEQLETHVEQVVNYAFQEAVNICVLTTGVVWRLYLPMESVPWPDRQFAELDLRAEDAADLSERLEKFLGYEELISGRAVTSAKQILLAEQREKQLRTEIPKAWRLLHVEANELLTELVQEEVHTAIGERPTQDQVSRFLKEVVSQPANQGAVLDIASRQGAASLEETPSAEVNVVPGPKATAANVVALRMWGQEYPVGNQKQAFTKAVDLVFQRHGSEFSKVIDNVTGFRHGTTQGLIGPHQIADSDYYVGANLSFRDKRMRLTQLLRLFGYRAEDFEFVTT